MLQSFQGKFSMNKYRDAVFSGSTGKGLLNNALFLPFITTFICSIFIYWFELSNFTLSIDEEFTDNFCQTLMMNRWFHAILRRWIFPEPFTPFASLFLGIIFLSFASSFMCKSLNINKESSIVFSLLMASIPQFAYQAEFSNQVDTVALSVLLASISFCVFTLNQCRVFSLSSLYGVILLTLSTSIYQSSHFITYPLTIAACAINLSNGDGRKSFKPLYFSVISIAAVTLYYVSAKLAQKTFGVGDYKYFSQLLAWGKTSTTETISNISSSVSSYFTADSYFGLSAYSLIPISFIMPFFLKGRTFNVRAGVAILVFLCALSPMLMILVMGTNQPARVMMSLPVAFACAFTLIYHFNLFKKTILIAACILVLISCVNVSKLFYSDKMAREADNSFYNDVISTVRLKNPSFSPYRNKIYFYGPYNVHNNWKLQNADVFGNSFFFWDGASNRRILAMLKTSNIADFIPLSENEEKKAKQIGKDLKNWPSVDSVGTFDNVVVVRLGDPWF